tara:strand:- start:270 stop:650 length:381 start_codon:yes stop_codon:yes gene_type:complete
MNKRGRKTNVEVINDYVWNKRICPKDYVLSVSKEKLVFTRDFVNVNSADQLVCTISKSVLPQSIILSHPSSKVLNECLDWLIKYCETFMTLMPEVKVTDSKVYDKLEAYQIQQKKYNKKRRKKKYK